MALTRVEKALSIPVDKVPGWFAHSVTPNKPVEPVTALGTEDQQRYDLWKGNASNGVQMGWEESNLSPALLTAMSNFKAYLAGGAYQAWAAVDQLSRQMQYKLFVVDVSEAVNAMATVPISADPSGIGTPAPSINDVTQLGKPPDTLIPDYVTTGDPNAPELVFGDDGDIVTVQ